MLKNIQLTLVLTIGIIALCSSAIIVHLHAWNFVAHQQGYNTEIYYRGYVAACKRSVPNERQKEFRRIYDLYATQIQSGTPFPEKQAYDTLDAAFKADDAIIEFFADGIFVLLSIAGLVMLRISRKRVQDERKAGQLRIFTWLFILIALYCHWFIAEFIFRLIEVGMGIPLKFPSWINWLSDHFCVNGWLLLSFNNLFSFLLLAHITFRIVPRRQLIPFLFAGLAGGILSRLIWYSWLGPILMPHP